MLDRAFEWYRIVNALPTSQTIDNRKAAIVDLISSIDDADDQSIALDCACGVVAGFDQTLGHDAQTVQTLVSKLRAHESAFPQELSENALELRACAAIALGEILARGGDCPATDAVQIASVLRAGLYSRPMPMTKYLQQMLQELDTCASKVLAASGRERRKQVSINVEQLGEMEEDDDSASLSSLRAVVQRIAAQSEIDREELNVLWWMFAGVSTTTGQRTAEMPVGAAIVCCGVELGNMCLVPPAASLEAIVRRALENGRSSQGLAACNIEAVARDWGAQHLRMLVADENVRHAAVRYPSLFPFSWTCNRLIESRGATGWAAEFNRMTQIPVEHVRSPVDWAVQVFRERVALRILTQTIGG